MLHRAASNACSWWWASHIRTKQSKWLEQCLQDMEEKVNSMMGLIEGNGDSFAKRAEMYYKRRPELIYAVEESYRTFKSLADRYDLLSKELQNANHTIATVCPDQVRYSMDDDYDDMPNKPPAHLDQSTNVPNVSTMGNDIPVPPKPPKAPADNLKSLITAPGKQFRIKKAPKKEDGEKKDAAPKSGFKKEDAVEKIEALQREILALQTTKEFVKSSYESGMKKYLEIENRISQMHNTVSALQDEFDVEIVIEDDEARMLMAEAALKSCDRTLSVLQEKQENFVRESASEKKRIESACEMLNLFKRECLKDQTNDSESTGPKSHGVEHSHLHLMTAADLAEKIDEVVNKVIGLETAVSTQAVLIDTSRDKADDLHKQIQMLNDEKESLIGDPEDLRTRVRELEEKLNGILNLTKNVESRNITLRSDFSQARSNLDQLSEKLNCTEDDEVGGNDPLPGKDTNDVQKRDNGSKVDKQGVKVKMPAKKSYRFLDEKPIAHIIEAAKAKKQTSEERERNLLLQCTDILKNYKDARKKLSESEFDTTQEIQNLKEANAKKDREIQSLCEKLRLLQENKEANEADINSKPQEEAAVDEENLRAKIHAILDENMEFWLRFSTANHEVQKFKTEIKDLQEEILKLQEKKIKEGVAEATSKMKSEARPHYKHLHEIQMEITAWLEQSSLLREELQGRFKSLSEIEKEVGGASTGDSCHRSIIKLEGEISSVKHEKSKVMEELEMNVDCVKKLREETDKALKVLKDEFGVWSERPQLQQSLSKARVPLRAFIFGKKPKPRLSLLTFMHSHMKFNNAGAGDGAGDGDGDGATSGSGSTSGSVSGSTHGESN